MPVFTFRVSLATSSVKPAPFDANGDPVPVYECSLSDLQLVQLALASEDTSNLSAPYNPKLEDEAGKLISGLWLIDVRSFKCNGSRPNGDYWEPRSERYLHPFNEYGQLCIAYDESTGKGKWVSMSICAER